MDRLVTVIVNSYNRPRLIRDALDSILAQTWLNVECIVADDFSMDEVHDVLNGYFRRFQGHGWRFQTIVPAEEPPTAHERQYGQRCSVCINAAMPYAKGEFVVFLPDDDMLVPRSIEVRAQYLIEHPEVNAVYGRLEACQSRMPDRFLPAKIAAGIHYVDKWPKDAEHIAFAQTSSVPYPHLDDEAWADTCCVHDRNGFWSAEPIARAANRVDHSMMMVRRVPNIIEGPLFNMSQMRQAELPEWPEVATAEALNTVSGLKREIRLDSGIGSVGVASCIETFGGIGERFDCPDAGFLFRLELAGLGPFHSVDEVVTVKRYHSMHHRTDPSRRE